MGLKTRAKFYYGFEVTSENNLVAIDEGSGRVDALLNTGKYTLSEYVNMLNSVFNDRFEQTYQFSINRETRIISISVDASVTLLIGDLSGGNTGFELMGYSGANQTNTAFIGDKATGKEFIPQFQLLDYVDNAKEKEFQDATVNESANGNVEIVSFGLKTYITFTLDWINNYNFKNNPWIEQSSQGEEDAQDFMDWCIQKGKIEMMKDRDNPSSFINILLEKTPESSKGVGYKLKEKKGLQGFFTTGRLRYRTI